MVSKRRTTKPATKKAAKKAAKRVVAVAVGVEADTALASGGAESGNTPAKAPKRAKNAKGSKSIKAAAGGFPARRQSPLPPELRGALPAGVAFEDLPLKAPFRYHEAVARGFNELWERVGERSYGPVGSDRDFVFPHPAGVLVIPA